MRIQIAGWVSLTAIAAGLRLYRPLVSANLGYSDTYVHLTSSNSWRRGSRWTSMGTLPRGLHFLLTASIMTNVE